jgi:hypothetical protein
MFRYSRRLIERLWSILMTFYVGVRVFLVRENGHCPYVSPGAAHMIQGSDGCTNYWNYNW